MPIYEYHCDSCGETVEVLLRHSDPVPSSCQELVDSERTSSCDGNGQLDKVLSVGGYQVRGGGSGGGAKDDDDVLSAIIAEPQREKIQRFHHRAKEKTGSAKFGGQPPRREPLTRVIRNWHREKMHRPKQTITARAHLEGLNTSGDNKGSAGLEWAVGQMMPGTPAWSGLFAYNRLELSFQKSV